MKNFQQQPPKGKPARIEYRYRYGDRDAIGSKLIDVTVHQRDGGRNDWHGTNETRGVEVMVTVWTVEDRSLSMILGIGNRYEDRHKTGLRIFAMPCPRYTPKKLAQFAEAMDGADVAMIAATWTVSPEANADARRWLVAAVKAAREAIAGPDPVPASAPVATEAR